MLRLRPTPLNQRSTVPNLCDPHRVHPAAQRLRSTAATGAKAPIAAMVVSVRILQ
jgi:hypothetical protein